MNDKVLERALSGNHLALKYHRLGRCWEVYDCTGDTLHRVKTFYSIEDALHYMLLPCHRSFALLTGDSKVAIVLRE